MQRPLLLRAGQPRKGTNQRAVQIQQRQQGLEVSRDSTCHSHRHRYTRLKVQAFASVIFFVLLSASSFTVNVKRRLQMSFITSLPGAEHPVHPVPEQTEAAPPRVRAEGQQMNGIIEDRASVSSTDMLVSGITVILWTFQ